VDSVPRTWLQAELACVARGGHLASVHDLSTNTFIHGVLLGKRPGPPHQQEAAIHICPPLASHHQYCGYPSGLRALSSPSTATHRRWRSDPADLDRCVFFRANKSDRRRGRPGSILLLCLPVPIYFPGGYDVDGDSFLPAEQRTFRWTDDTPFDFVHW
jgi:hypothetical protein